MLERKPKRYRYPLELISIAVWSYHRFNDSYRDVSERLLYRGIDVSYETIRQWCIKWGLTSNGTKTYAKNPDNL
ncbi:TPA: IS6 family transposase [Legionella pneumophila]|nr:IS6 family transposase [Legionella pneumophila]HAU0358280.1 IS6 family transposase [Legionella pneumophila]HAU0567450.1 IS6 family transposase [Legionella pneumophila]